MNSQTQVQAKFSGMTMILPKILETIERLKFTHPTPIQSKAIPLGIEGKDIVGIAQTGTGKTLAFAVPILQQILKQNPRDRKLGLVVVPTRELALQVDEIFQQVGRSLGLKTVVLIGGAHIGNQIRMMRNNPQVIIGTPGRIIDLLQRRSLNLRNTNILVLDEADRMFDMGFAPQIKRILQDLPRERQTMLFSATMPDDIAKMAKQYMKNPIRIEIARAGTIAENIKQEVFLMQKDQKNRTLGIILDKCRGTVLVFSRTKFGARKICKSVKNMGHTASEIHSNRSLSQRREALSGFKIGKYRVLVATDIASRGIDVDDIELIVNYDIPEKAEDYVHRIGRTGRAGHEGHAISFATPDQHKKLNNIERFTHTRLNIIKQQPQYR
jgi:ATP-dependent RNA helicase RhlE